ncbi:class I SAM-dependent methyltransferase, partial [Escherichia coli]|uniref:class I SAM-dependent methyltransferase n=1 Tax=Escherichia coli TaxID=562 RepID=UPI00215A4D18
LMTSCAPACSAATEKAQEVINIDMASGALALGRENHQRNGLTGARFLAHDIFHSWGKLKRLGPYGLVIADPPSYQKG